MSNKKDIVHTFHEKGKGFRVVEVIDRKDIYDFEGTTGDLFEKLERDLEYAKTLYESYGFDPDTFDDKCVLRYQDASWYESIEIELRLTRPEMKEERAARLAKQKKEREAKKLAQDVKDAQELAEYERLKKKFGAKDG